MTVQPRRTFLKDSAQVATALTGASFLLQLPAVAAQETSLNSDMVTLDSGIEPTVQLIEKTPRGELIEELAKRVKNGLAYREVLAALLLAGIRNVQPKPSVGFKFHCVLVVNSCHLASISGPDSDRWLPIFWAVDYFKSSQAREANQSGWKMQPVKESLLPRPADARKMFTEAMDSWDAEKADAATVGICRYLGATQVFDLYSRYAARDYRSIGHKAIYLANAWRTLQVIGWQFAEPVLRSLTTALLNHGSESNPATSDHKVDRPWRQNAQMISSIPENWQQGKLDHAIPLKLIETFRTGTAKDAADQAVDALQHQVSPQSIWDGVFLGAGELLMRQPGIIGLHGLTTANAMHFLWKQALDPVVRQRIMLQACSFNPLFRDSAKARGQLRDRQVEKLKTAQWKAPPREAIPEILSDISSNPARAAEKVRGFLAAGGSGQHFVNETRKLIFQKGHDAHDYKFSSAVLEDYAHVSSEWRDEFLAMSVFQLKGTGDRDNSLNKRIRTSLK